MRRRNKNMTRTITVEGDITAVDTRTYITTQGSVTAPSLVVPSGFSKIDKIIAACAPEALADGSATFFIRLSGGAVLNGEQTIMISSAGRIAVQSGSDAAPEQIRAWQLDDVDIPIRSGDNIAISAEMAGTDLGTAHVVITLVFA